MDVLDENAPFSLVNECESHPMIKLTDSFISRGSSLLDGGDDIKLTELFEK